MSAEERTAASLSDSTTDTVNTDSPWAKPPAMLGGPPPAARKPRHICATPVVGSPTIPLQPDWTCAACGRIWRDMGGLVRVWSEIRGPIHFPMGETL